MSDLSTFVISKMNTDSDSIQLRNIGRVARVCGVSVRTVKRWINRDGLPAFKLGGSWMIEKSDLDAWLMSKRIDVKR